MVKNQVMVKETHHKDIIEKFWKGVWGEKKPCKLGRKYGERK